MVTLTHTHVLSTLIAGADGCRDGWIVVQEDLAAAHLSWAVYPDLAGLFSRANPPDLLALDIPIGLPQSGPRSCDLAARSVLGPGRASSVFPAPIRPILAATTYEEAGIIGRQVHGKGLSKQAWAIVPKIRAVDQFLRQGPIRQGRVREIHPEVSFFYLTGRPMAHAKKTRAGRQERLDALAPIFGPSLETAMGSLRQLRCAADDLLDAFVALWTARRIRAGIAVTLPAAPISDPHGLAMEMLA